MFKRKGRSTYTFQGRTPTGWEQIGISTKDKSLANRVEDMWETLASKERAWDILEPVLDAGRKRAQQVMRLYDLWVDCGRDVEEMRRKLNDVDIEPLVNEYMGVYRRKGYLPSTAKYTESHIRFLLPEGKPCPASSIDEDMLTKRLYEYEGESNMLRKVHSSWNGFFDYLVRPKRIYPVSPMLHVSRPDLTDGVIQFYELEIVEKIIAKQPTLERKALYSLIYGTGLEQIVVVGRKSPRFPALTRSKFNESTHEVRAAGTKTQTRDRIALVSDWAWPTVHEYLRWKQSDEPLFNRDRSTVTHWHLETLRDLNKESARQGTPLNLPEYPLHCARDHWAVRQLRAGAPIGVVQRQLGHATAKETLDTYGTFIPDGIDRAKWEKEATEYDNKRRAAR